jgi:hypothetical protein
MAEGTRLHQLSNSVKECQDAITQQQVTNNNVDTQLREVTEMLWTLMVNQPPPEPQNFVMGHDDRRHPELEWLEDQRQLDHGLDRQEDRDARRFYRDDDDDDRRI